MSLIAPESIGQKPFRLFTLAAFIIVSGLAMFLLSGKDIYLRLGVVFIACLFLYTAIHLLVLVVRKELRAERIFNAIASAILHFGIVLLLVSLIIFLIREMLDLRMRIESYIDVRKFAALGALLLVAGIGMLLVPSGVNAIKSHSSEFKRSRVILDLATLLFGMTLLLYIAYVLIRFF